MLVRTLCFLAALSVAAAIRPVVLWHGMGDTCCYPFSMGAVKKEIEKSLPGIYVASVELGGSIVQDELEGFIGNVNNQVASVCAKLKADKNLAGGFDAIGFSQGSQFLRAYVQRCNDPPIHNLITFGGQHMGVSALPHCMGLNQTLCKLMAELLAKGAYTVGVRNVSVQAQYFRAPLEYDTYLKDNIFLPDINNERDTKNATYKANLQSLNALVLIMFANDTMVIPRESSWFGSFQIGSLTALVPMQQQPLYTNDWIGLRTLDQAGKVVLKSCPGDHMHFTMDYLHDEVIVPYLGK
eukprot:m.222386 g.222386  ORF g.222386 m.222386 type:complete len:296 (-) comp16018_c0_seq1:92-979(-)